MGVRYIAGTVEDFKFRVLALIDAKIAKVENVDFFGGVLKAVLCELRAEVEKI